MTESAPDNLHVHIGVSHSGNGSHRLDHMADHIDNGQVDDGPVESKLWLRTFRAALLLLYKICVCVIHLH